LLVKMDSLLPSQANVIANKLLNLEEKDRIDARLQSLGCNIDQTSILTTKQRQAAVELFRGIDVDKNAMLSQEEIEEACGNLLGLTAGMRDAADEMMSTIDSSLYKTKFEHYTTADGEQVVREQRVELAGSSDGRIDLPEWLQYLRKVKQEKVQDMLKHPMFTPEQSIIAANKGIDKWFRNMMADLRVWQSYRKDNAREEKALKREEELMAKTEILLNSPRSQSKSELSNLNDGERKQGIGLFRKMDIDKSGLLELEEISCIFPSEARARKLHRQIDTDGSGSVGLDEWCNFLRKLKRDAVTVSLSEHPANITKAKEAGSDALTSLYREVTTGLESDKVLEARRQITVRNREMDADTRRLMNPLSVDSTLKLQPSDAARRKRAEIQGVKKGQINLHYTPERKLVYDPSSAYPYSKAEGGGAPSCITDWDNRATKGSNHAEFLDSAAQLIVKHATEVRQHSMDVTHELYTSSTEAINVRVADCHHAQSHLYRGLAVCEDALTEVTQAAETVTEIFEQEADALDEIVYLKQTRALRPDSERVYDDATLAIKHREEELDPANHEIMLGKLDKLRRSLRRLQKKLNYELGTKLVGNEVDLQALSIEPGAGGSETSKTDSEIELNRSTASRGLSHFQESELDTDDGTKLVTLPRDKYALFHQFSKNQKLRGTALPSTPSFEQVSAYGSLMDPAEYMEFVRHFRLDQLLDLTKLMHIFHSNCLQAKTHMNVIEFESCVPQLETAARAAQKQWALERPEPKKFQSPTKETSLTVVQLQNKLKEPTNRPAPLHETQALPLVEPVSWKKNLRGLGDDTVRLAKEATRLLDKANEFVAEHRLKDVEGRNKMIAAISKKVNLISDQIASQNVAIDQTESDMQADAKEMVNVEMRQSAVDDFLTVALARLEKRVERPIEEQARDPAHYALELEIRQARAEMAKLNADHVRLSRSVIDLAKLKKRLEVEVQDKEEAVKLENECVTRLSVHLVKI